MSVELDNINKQLYESADGVSSYIDTVLQAPEVTIFVNYRNEFYNKKILDIGCGAGRTTHYLINFTSDYTGVDYSNSMIAYCKDRYRDTDFFVSDVRDLSRFSDNEFDFILFSYNGLDYINDSDRKKALKEIYRVLKKGSIFVFSAHNRNHPHIIVKPVFSLSLNPKKLIRNIMGYFVQRKNRGRLNKEEINNDEYAIINDSGNNFGLLTYYIDRVNQELQLNKIGFELLDTYGMDGKRLSKDSVDRDFPWIYYIAKKM